MVLPWKCLKRAIFLNKVFYPLHLIVKNLLFAISELAHIRNLRICYCGMSQRFACPTLGIFYLPAPTWAGRQHSGQRQGIFGMKSCLSLRLPHRNSYKQPWFRTAEIPTNSNDSEPQKLLQTAMIQNRRNSYKQQWFRIAETPTKSNDDSESQKQHTNRNDPEPQKLLQPAMIQNRRHI
jgi:hypothetical protein